MDNASKAIVIAGAVLIAVMIISLGVFLFNSASNTGKDFSTSMVSKEILQYNSRYSTYTGAGVSYSDTKSLINNIRQHNSNVEELGQYSRIAWDVNGSNENMSSLKPTETYKIEISSYDSQGVITGIHIEKQ